LRKFVAPRAFFVVVGAGVVVVTVIERERLGSLITTDFDVTAVVVAEVQLGSFDLASNQKWLVVVASAAGEVLVEFLR
jgi:hypothetical protein